MRAHRHCERGGHLTDDAEGKGEQKHECPNAPMVHGKAYSRAGHCFQVRLLTAM
jgi:hypothetical protein